MDVMEEIMAQCLANLKFVRLNLQAQHKNGGPYAHLFAAVGPTVITAFDEGEREFHGAPLVKEWRQDYVH